MKSKNGITLVALVVTIIVLLILAGISLSMVVGNNGIIIKANTAVLKTREANIAQRIADVWADIDGWYWEDWTYDQTVRREEYFIEDDFAILLEEEGLVKNFKKEDNGYIEFVYAPYDENELYKVEIETSGQITAEIYKELLSDAVTADNYGNKVTNYTSKNGLSDWKIFYNDGEHIFLIASDFVPRETIDLEKTGMVWHEDETQIYSVHWPQNLTITELQETSQIDLFRLNESNPYILDETKENSLCVSTLLNVNNWTNFIDKNNFGQYAIGGPTIEMWMTSWNEKYNDTLAYASGEKGYKVGVNSVANVNNINQLDMKYKDGYKDGLYYSRTSVESDGCYGYWLASPSNRGTYDLCDIYYNGAIGGMCYYGDQYQTGHGIRPVICLNSSVMGKQNEDGSWTLSL